MLGLSVSLFLQISNEGSAVIAMDTVYVVMLKKNNGERVIHEIRSDYQDACNKSRSVPREMGVSYVDAWRVEKPNDNYDVWVCLGETGVVLEVAKGLSIPESFDTFVPMVSHDKYHGRITVQAKGMMEAGRKAAAIMVDYVGRLRFRIPVTPEGEGEWTE